MKQLTPDEFVAKAASNNPHALVYLPENFTGLNQPFTAHCPIHGAITKKAGLFLRTTGCSKCAAISRGEISRTNLQNWINKASIVHGNKYDYSKVSFATLSDYVIIGCPFHGEMQQQAGVHMAGHGCWECRNATIAGRPISEFEQFVAKARQAHGDAYHYEEQTYTGMSNIVTVHCSIHGAFNQIGNAHVRGQGCPACALDRHKLAMTNDLNHFIAKSTEIHGVKYDYSKAIYTGVMNKIEIGCPTHGWFWQAAGDHMRGYNCSHCGAQTYVSNPEIEIVKFIRECSEVVVRTSDRTVIPPFELDIYIPELQIAIEYCGLYWHSELVGKNNTYHLNKHVACQQKGIRLITIFEDEWNEKRPIVLSTIKHFLGKSPKGVYGRNVTIQPISWTTAKPFIDEHHLLGAGTPATTMIGAYDGTRLCGVMTFGSPANEQGGDWVVEMKRYATDGNNNPGVASKMFAYAIKKYGWTRVSAFVDRRWFTGSFKAIADFKLERVTKPSVFWTDFKSRYHRRKFSSIRSPLGGKTKAQLLYEEHKVSRIWDCGKAVMVWEKNNEI